MRELDLIRAIRAQLTSRGGRIVRWTGDDAAVVRSRPLAVTSIDTVVDGVHFELATHSAADVGWKALATALSDLAAMGAEPGEAYVSLGLPGDFDGGLDLVAGMEELASGCEVTIAGGDVVRSPVLSVCVCVTGWADSEEALVGRDGARPGDLLGVTGTLGGSEGGRLALAGEVELHNHEQRALVARHRRPLPRLREGLTLGACGASAMIDLSDGLASDARHLAQSSGVRLRVRLDDLPLASGLERVGAACGRSAAELAAAGGDDYELLFTLPPERRAGLEQVLGVTWLGEVEAGEGVELLDAQGLALPDLRGYEHD